MGEIGDRDEEYTYRDEHWVMPRAKELLYFTPETKKTLVCYLYWS